MTAHQPDIQSLVTDPFDTRLTIDLAALASNYAVLKAAASGAEVAPAVKADGYGIGAAMVADRLWAEGARGFYTARLSEGLALRESLGDREATIYVLDGVTPGSAPAMEAARLTPVLNSLPQIEAWNSHARGGRLAATIHVDTGMNRLGLRIEELQVLLGAMDRLKHVEVTGVMSHLACANEPAHPLNARQLERFQEAAALFPNARKSLANSAGIFLGSDYAFDQVRPGVSLTVADRAMCRTPGSRPSPPWKRRSCRPATCRAARASAMARPIPPPTIPASPSSRPAMPTASRARLIRAAQCGSTASVARCSAASPWT